MLRSSFAAVLFLPILFTTAHPAIPPSVSYILTIDSTRLHSFSVVMNIRHAPDTLRLAFARHPEYDEQFWKLMTDLTIETRGRRIPAVRRDSALWVAPTQGGDVVVRYRFEWENDTAQVRRSWRMFVRETGGLVGGNQSFLYLVGHESLPARVTLKMPAGWRVATGLARAGQPMTFRASNVDELIDSPILVGDLRFWSFAVDGVPHEVAYWPLPGDARFDTATFVGTIERIVRAAAGIFKTPPYHRYVFLMQDGAGDALEHLNSLTLGAQSASLAKDPSYLALEIAHEYFHTWNLVRIRPAEQCRVSYKPPVPTGQLWWSEGVTMYYANALLHRAGLLDSAAMKTWLAENIANYMQNPGNFHISPERASRSAADPAASDSIYRASYYTLGTLLGQWLAIAIRDSTHMRRGLDDVMRRLNAQFSRSKGFSGRDLERAVNEVCGCRMDKFFDNHVRGSQAIDLDSFLISLGLHADLRTIPAADSSGHPLPDTRVFPYIPDGGGRVRLLIYNAPNAWTLAGLRSGDEVLALDGRQIAAPSDFRRTLAGKKLNDTMIVEYLRAGVAGKSVVRLTGYERVQVELQDLPNRTPRQREMFRRWCAGTL